MATKDAGTNFPAAATATIVLEGGKLYVQADDGTVDSIRVAAGGTLTFVTAEDSPIQWWSILLKAETPFGDRTGWAAEARGRKQSKGIDRRANGGDTGERRYAYAVTVSDGKQVHFLDPEVIVGPEDT